MRLATDLVDAWARMHKDGGGGGGGESAASTSGAPPWRIAEGEDDDANISDIDIEDEHNADSATQASARAAGQDSPVGGGSPSHRLADGDSAGDAEREADAPEFSLAQLPEVDLSHLDGFSNQQLLRIIGPFYDYASPRSGERIIEELSALVNAGKPTKDLAHRLRGDATTSGAKSLALLVLDFHDAPAPFKIEGLKRALKGTTARLKADGVLQ